jgi:hypothetical protein
MGMPKLKAGETPDSLRSFHVDEMIFFIVTNNPSAKCQKLLLPSRTQCIHKRSSFMDSALGSR